MLRWGFFFFVQPSLADLSGVRARALATVLLSLFDSNFSNNVFAISVAVVVCVRHFTSKSARFLFIVLSKRKSLNIVDWHWFHHSLRWEHIIFACQTDETHRRNERWSSLVCKQFCFFCAAFSTVRNWQTFFVLTQMKFYFLAKRSEAKKKKSKTRERKKDEDRDRAINLILNWALLFEKGCERARARPRQEFAERNCWIEQTENCETFQLKWFHNNNRQEIGNIVEGQLNPIVATQRKIFASADNVVCCWCSINISSRRTEKDSQSQKTNTRNESIQKRRQTAEREVRPFRMDEMRERAETDKDAKRAERI